MDPEQWRNVKAAFAVLIDLPQGERAACVDEVAGHDPAVRAEVLSLLEAHAAAERADWQGPRRKAPDVSTAPVFDDRFVVEGRLGAGGFGVVYRAFDRKLERHVAIKTLRQQHPAGLVRFKNEFRTLADLTHANLLRLFELFAAERQVYFSMELVEGHPMVPLPTHEPVVAAVGGVRSMDRVARLFLQLAHGVRVLHQAGVIHRDLKPSNVLVTPADRVVILDFGLATDARHGEPGQTAQMIGTLGYMAPEQFRGQPASEASDWYAVGVMLANALRGRSHGPGGAGAAVSAVDTTVDTAESRRALLAGADPFPPGVPPGLAALCLELTAAEPSDRPSGGEIIARLTRWAPQAPRAPSASPAPVTARTPAFVGRHEQLAALRASFAQTRAGHITAACVLGASGMGKTALVQRFLDELRSESPAPIVLTARCHEREALGYKAFDGIVDGLSGTLRRLPRAQAEPLLPENVHELARLFPVLLQDPAVAGAPRGAFEATGVLEQRRRAFDAFRELLGALARTAPVVLFIDDLQWGDFDSAALLRHLLRPPAPPPVLLIVACRREEVETPVASRLLQALSAAPTGVRQIVVEALEPAAVRALARSELGDAGELIEAVVREAAGVPIFARELLNEAKQAPARLTAERGALELEGVIAARLKRLSAAERALLEVVAIAGKPLDRGVARSAVALDAPDAHDAEQSLLANRMLRVGDSGQALETQHDLIRELVTRTIEPPRATAVHRRLAEALLAHGDTDPEDLAQHFRSAGALDRAADFATRAARRWADALAFGRAAALYRMALDLRPDTHPDANDLMLELAHALANAGRGMEAANAYLQAAERLPEQNLSMTCRAAEQLLQSGDVTRGRAVVKSLLRSVGWSVPETPSGLLASIVLRRAQLAVRGLKLRARPPAAISQRQLVRLDASWALVSGLSLIDTVQANYFQNHHLLQALSVGDPRRLLRALAAEAAYCAMPGTRRSRPRSEAVLRTLRAVAAEHPAEPIGEPMVAIGSAMAAWMYGDWKTCQEQATQAERLFRERCTGVAWELGTARTFMLGTLTFMGRYSEYNRVWPDLVEDARARGDVFAETKLVLIDRSHAAALANDDPAGALAAVERALAMWDSDGFHLQDFWALNARVEIALYRGDRRSAWRLLQDAQPAIKRSWLLRVQALRIWLHQTRARAALALAAAPDGPKTTRHELLREALRDVRAIEREGTTWGAAMAHLLRGLADVVTGEDERGAARLAEAVVRLTGANMPIYAAAATVAQGSALGGAEGAALTAKGEAQMREHDVVDPQRFGAVLAPGHER